MKIWGTRKQKLKGERGKQFPMAMVGKRRKKGFKLSAALEVLFSFLEISPMAGIARHRKGALSGTSSLADLSLVFERRPEAASISLMIF